MGGGDKRADAPAATAAPPLPSALGGGGTGHRSLVRLSPPGPDEELGSSLVSSDVEFLRTCGARCNASLSAEVRLRLASLQAGRSTPSRSMLSATLGIQETPRQRRRLRARGLLASIEVTPPAQRTVRPASSWGSTERQGIFSLDQTGGAFVPEHSISSTDTVLTKQVPGRLRTSVEPGCASACFKAPRKHEAFEATSQLYAKARTKIESSAGSLPSVHRSLTALGNAPAAALHRTHEHALWRAREAAAERGNADGSWKHALDWDAGTSDGSVLQPSRSTLFSVRDRDPVLLRSGVSHASSDAAVSRLLGACGIRATVRTAASSLDYLDAPADAGRAQRRVPTAVFGDPDGLDPAMLPLSVSVKEAVEGDGVFQRRRDAGGGVGGGATVASLRDYALQRSTVGNSTVSTFGSGRGEPMLEPACHALPRYPGPGYSSARTLGLALAAAPIDTAHWTPPVPTFGVSARFADAAFSKSPRVRGALDEPPVDWDRGTGLYSPEAGRRPDAFMEHPIVGLTDCLSRPLQYAGTQQAHKRRKAPIGITRDRDRRVAAASQRGVVPTAGAGPPTAAAAVDTDDDDEELSPSRALSDVKPVPTPRSVNFIVENRRTAAALTPEHRAAALAERVRLSEERSAAAAQRQLEAFEAERKRVEAKEARRDHRLHLRKGQNARIARWLVLVAIAARTAESQRVLKKRRRAMAMLSEQDNAARAIQIVWHRYRSRQLAQKRLSSALTIARASRTFLFRKRMQKRRVAAEIITQFLVRVTLDQMEKDRGPDKTFLNVIMTYRRRVTSVQNAVRRFIAWKRAVIDLLMAKWHATELEITEARAQEASEEARRRQHASPYRSRTRRRATAAKKKGGNKLSSLPTSTASSPRNAPPPLSRQPSTDSDRSASTVSRQASLRGDDGGVAAAADAAAVLFSEEEAERAAAAAEAASAKARELHALAVLNLPSLHSFSVEQRHAVVWHDFCVRKLRYVREEMPVWERGCAQFVDDKMRGMEAAARLLQESDVSGIDEDAPAAAQLARELYAKAHPLHFRMLPTPRELVALVQRAVRSRMRTGHVHQRERTGRVGSVYASPSRYVAPSHTRSSGVHHHMLQASSPAPGGGTQGRRSVASARVLFADT